MKSRVLLAAVLAALAAPGMAHAAVQTLARPHLYRPNPIFTSVTLDYIQPPKTPTGGVASLSPLSERVIAAAVLDQQRLSYKLLDDLGGFVPAPLGQLALSSGGHDVVGAGNGQAQIPLFQHHAGGQVNAFTFTGSGAGLGPPDNGQQPVPGLGVPPPVPPATNNNTVPPANQGFAGNGGGGGSKQGGGNGPGTAGTGGGAPGQTGTGPPPQTTRGTTTPRTTTARTTTHATTTSATVSTTVPTTTVLTTTTTTSSGGGGGGGGGGRGGGGGGGSCGGDGITIEPAPGNPSGCTIRLFNAKPGDEEHEVLTITNSSGAPYTLALKVSGAQNQLWHDLEMGVWENGTPTPNPLPPLLFWATQYNDLVTLQPGQSISYRIELFLPVEAGNVDQSLTAIISFNWKGH